MDELLELQKLKEELDLASKKEVSLLISELIKKFKELKESFAKEVSGYKKSVDSGMSDISEHMDKCSSMCKEVDSDLKSDLKTTEKHLTSLIAKSSKETLGEAYKSLNREVYAIEQLIKNIPQYDSTQLENKFSAVIFDIESKLNSIEIPELSGESIVDKINSLPTEEDKQINKEHIKGLEDWLKKIEERFSNIPRGGRGGTGNSVQYHDISSELNGSTKAFTIPKHRRVLLVSGTSSPTVFRPTVDYTVAGKTLTFTDAIDAPTTLSSGQTITVLYVGLFNTI